MLVNGRAACGRAANAVDFFCISLIIGVTVVRTESKRKGGYRMSDIDFRTFPEDEIEALAMLYIQQQDLSEISPETLYDMYRDACDKIRRHRRETRGSNRSSQRMT